MTRYSVQPRDRIFVKCYGFLSVTKNMGKNIGKYLSKNVSSTYTQKLFDYAEQSATEPLKTTSKKAIQKTAEATGDLIGNKIADAVAKLYNGKITRVSKASPQNNSETATNEEERYNVSPEKRQKVTEDLRLI